MPRRRTKRYFCPLFDLIDLWVCGLRSTKQATVKQKEFIKPDENSLALLLGRAFAPKIPLGYSIIAGEFEILRTQT